MSQVKAAAVLYARTAKELDQFNQTKSALARQKLRETGQAQSGQMAATERQRNESKAAKVAIGRVETMSRAAYKVTLTAAGQPAAATTTGETLNDSMRASLRK